MSTDTTMPDKTTPSPESSPTGAPMARMPVRHAGPLQRR